MYRFKDDYINQSIDQLGTEFSNLNWDFSPDIETDRHELVSHWLGEENEEVMINVFKGKKITEQFHRQDFFFFHFAYQNHYDTLSANYGNRITINEGECYIGQPYNGYAANRDEEDECIIIGVLIRKDTFIQEFIASISANTELLNFFLEPQKNHFSEEFIHIKIPDDSPIRLLLGIMINEYAHRNDNTQKIIKPLANSLALYIFTLYKNESNDSKKAIIVEMMEYIESNVATITLHDLAHHFGFHHVYLSRLLPQKTGKTFSRILLDIRMTRAQLFLKNTDLPIEKISEMLGYSNSSNFYKAFRDYYKTTPRNLLKENDET